MVCSSRICCHYFYTLIKFGIHLDVFIFVFRLWHISRHECICSFQHVDFVTAICFHPRVCHIFTTRFAICLPRLEMRFLFTESVFLPFLLTVYSYLLLLRLLHRVVSPVSNRTASRMHCHDSLPCGFCGGMSFLPPTSLCCLLGYPGDSLLLFYLNAI